MEWFFLEWEALEWDFYYFYFGMGIFGMKIFCNFLFWNCIYSTTIILLRNCAWHSSNGSVSALTERQYITFTHNN